MSDLLKPPPVPCGSCPYRRDVPAGIWSAEEYEKLRRYDGDTWLQSPKLFFCHQKDGCLCGGWLATHDTTHLFALRVNGDRVDPSAWDYAPDVPVFASGAEAADHGMSGIEDPGPEACRKIDGLMRLRARAER